MKCHGLMRARTWRLVRVSQRSPGHEHELYELGGRYTDRGIMW